MMVYKPSTVFFLVCCLSISACDGTFLRKQTNAASQHMNQTFIEQRFLEEVRGFVGGKGQMDADLPAITEALRPMWLALPKNEHGRLGNAQIRYALHRFFVQRHGWHIDGLDRTAGEASPAGVLRERVPTFLMDLFEEAFGKSGLMLHELAIFAGTIEHLIHDEATQRVHDVYSALSLEGATPLNGQQAEKALQTFVMSLILGQDKLKVDLAPHFNYLEQLYPGWKDAKTWLRSFLKGEEDVEYTLDEMLETSEKMSRQLGTFLDKECRQIKGVLLEAEEKKSGRLPLSSFYGKGKEHGFHFVEKPDFLRNLGALDESKAGEPRLIVPNFVLSKSNCLVDTGFYSVCCISECEGLMGTLEAQLATSEASPEQILKVVSTLSTSTVQAPRELPPSEVLRLELAAERSGGKIPLHGRLFAQWLHFVFPRECPMPHAAGAAAPLTASEWMEVNKEKINMKMSEVDNYLQTVETMADVATETEEKSIWSDDEEILYLPSAAQSQVSTTWGLGRCFLTFVGVLALAGFVFVASTENLKRSGTLESCIGLKLEKPHLV